MEYALTVFSRTTQHEKDTPAILPATLVNMVCHSFLAVCAVAGFPSPVMVGAQPFVGWCSAVLTMRCLSRYNCWHRNNRSKTGDGEATIGNAR